MSKKTLKATTDSIVTNDVPTTLPPSTPPVTLPTLPPENTVYVANTTVLKPIAYAGEINPLFKDQDPLGNLYATELNQQYGFGALFSTSEGFNGLPPDRLDFNTFMNLITSVVAQQQRGVKFTYNNAVAIYLYGVDGQTQLGYYPPNSVLFEINSKANFIKINTNPDNLPTTGLFDISTSQNWKQISNLGTALVQNGRLTGMQGLPYDDTPTNGTSTPNLYFTPTEQGNLISLFNGVSWVTQPFNEISLPVGTLIDVLEQQGSLKPIGSYFTQRYPLAITISPDIVGQPSTIYVTNNANNTASQYNRDKTTGLLSQSSFGSPVFDTDRNPVGIVVSPDGNQIYFVNSLLHNTGQIIRNADGSGGRALADAPQSSIEPLNMVITPLGDKVYVICQTYSDISGYRRDKDPISPTYGQIFLADEIPSNSLLDVPYGLVMSPDGLNMYATNTGTTVGYSITTIDTPIGGTVRLVSNIATANTPYGIVVSFDGRNVYCVNAGINQGSNTISQYSRSSDGTLSAIGTGTAVPTGRDPRGIAITPDGVNVYVTNALDNTISKYSRDLITGILTPIDTDVITHTGITPVSIITSNDGKYVYVVNRGDGSSNGSVSAYSRNLSPPVTVRLTSPTSTTGVSVTPTITLTFSEPVTGVNPISINFKVTSATTLLTITSLDTQDNLSWTLRLGTGVTPLQGFTQYSVIVNAGISSIASGNTVDPTSFNFTTVDSLLPSVDLTSPNPPNNVDIRNVVIQLTFNELVTGVNTTSIQFLPQFGQPLSITVSPLSATFVCTLTVPLPLLQSTTYLVVVNAGIQDADGSLLPPVTFRFATASPPPPPSAGGTYDIFVGNTTSNVFTLARYDLSTTTASNRVRLSNGKWVNANGLSTLNGTIPQYQALFVGSIKVLNNAGLTNGTVQSWYGNRSIWNLYNQVSKPLYAVISTGWSFDFSNSFLEFAGRGNQNIGQGKFLVIIDLLYNRAIRLNYAGSIDVTLDNHTPNNQYANLNYTAGFSIALVSSLNAFTLTRSAVVVQKGGDGSVPNWLFNNGQITYNTILDKSDLLVGLNTIQRLEQSQRTPSTLDSVEDDLTGSITVTDQQRGLIAEFWC